MRSLLVLLALVAVSFAADAVTWSGRQDGGVLSLTPAELEIGTVQEAGGNYVTLALPEAGLAAEVGRPAVPVYLRLVEIPYGCEVKVSVDLGATETQQLALPVIPRQAPIPKTPSADFQTPKFELDGRAYSTDAYAPEIGARLVEVAIVRGQRVAAIEVRPVGYNPVRNLVEYAPRMRVTVKWTGADWTKTRAMLRRYSSPPFAGRIAGIAVNEKQFRTSLGAALPIGYLIIVPDEWQSNIAPLAEWRRRKGFNVFVRTLSQVGGGGNDTVKAYIQNAYDNWSIPPSFVLLVGDVDRIGYFTGSGEGNPPTDLNYSLCEGSDYWPDLDLGRASMASAAQLDSFVDKVVRYEQNNWGAKKGTLPQSACVGLSAVASPFSPGQSLFSAGTEWLKKAYFVASADGSMHGTAENTHKYAMAKIRLMGTECDSLWTYYGSGTPVDSALNNGRAWITFSGHGSEEGWSDPGISFHSDNVRALANNDMIPLVQTYACLCGNFSSSSYPECFSETWIRLGRKGGIVSMASSVTSYWTEDDTLERRVYDYMFDSSYTWIMGGFNKAKVKFYQQMGDNSTTRRYFEMYNCMGDGGTDIYSLEPKPLVATYPAVIPVGSYALQVSVTTAGNAVPGALVCASAKSDTNAWAAGYTKGSGQVTLNLTTYAPDTVFVTVTGHNLAPHLGHCLALPSNGPYVMYLHHTVDDSAGGNNDHIINPGETINLPMWLKNWGNQQAQSVTARLRKTDPNITLLDTLKDIGDIPAGDSAWTGTNSFKFTVAPSCTNGYALRFSVVARDSRDTTWTSSLTLLVGAPRLGYASYRADDPPPGGNGNGMIDPGETGDIVTTLRNTGLGNAYGVTATLRSTDARLQVTDSTGSFGNIPSDTTGSNNADRFTVFADPSIPRETQVPCTLVVSTGGIIRRLGFSVSVGVIRTRDPIPDGPRTPARYWAYDEVDSGYSERPDYNWVEVAGIGTELNLADDTTCTISLPSEFGPFRFYGQGVTTLSISSNGWVGLGSTTSDARDNTSLPSSSLPIGAMAINWDDCYPPAGHGIWYYHDAANHRFVIEYDSIPYWSNQSAFEKYEIILYDTTLAAQDGNCEFEFQYQTAARTSSSCVGMQDPTMTIGVTCVNDNIYTRGASLWVPGHVVKYTTDVPHVAVAEPAWDMTQLSSIGIVSQAPNPFRGATLLRYAVPREMRLSLAVYDRAGRKVTTLFSGLSQPGIRTAAWDGRDDQGRRASQGVYFWRLESESTPLTRKAIKID
jgi:hypothetical protein